MITDEQLTSIIETLVTDNFVKINIEGMQMRLSLWHDGQFIHLATTIYQGDNYIPPSVRTALKQCSVGPAELLKVNFIVDENAFRISLECTGDFHEDHQAMKDLFYEFCWLADEWKLLLNQKGKEDLLPIYIRK